jgi:hypothetical protein
LVIVADFEEFFRQNCVCILFFPPSELYIHPSLLFESTDLRGGLSINYETRKWPLLSTYVTHSRSRHFPGFFLDICSLFCCLFLSLTMCVYLQLYNCTSRM